MGVGGSNTTAIVTLNANMDPSGVLSAVKAMQGAFNNLKLPNNIGDNLDKSLSKATELLKKYQSQLQKGINTKTDAKNISKTGVQINEVLDDINHYINDLNGQQIFLKADVSGLNKLQANIENARIAWKNAIQEFRKSSNIDTVLNGIGEKTTRSNLTQGSISKAKTLFDKGDLEGYKNALDEVYNRLSKLKDTTISNVVKNLGLEDAGSKAANLELIKKQLESISKINFSNDSNVKQQFDEITNSVTAYENEVKRAGNAGQQAFNDINANKAVNDTRALVNATNQYTDSLMSAKGQVQDLQRSTQYFFSLRNMINLLKRGIDDAIQSVKELDAAMTETAVVTDYKVSDLWGMLPQYTQLANQLGATTQGAYETMTLYFQQGLDQQQAFEIGAETMKMARIAGLDYAETTDMMTAALRGFNMELNETSAKRINDVYSELAAITASDTEELGTAMQRTASIAHSAGMSFEGTTAFLAQAIETTREPAENIGTAMKTIVARFQEMKKNPLEISEVDGEEVDYNKVDAALKSIGVSLKDTNGQFRELDQVFLDISSRWDGLSQTQQRYIATVAAGSRQQSRFIAMMDNYDRTVQLFEAANNSAGASDEQFGKTMDSLESKLNKLHNAWQAFTMGIANNGMIKFAVDGLTGFLTVTNKIIDTLSLGSGAIKSFLSIFAAFTGLKMAGRAANSLIGGLGGLVDPQSTVKEGLKIGLFGQGKSNIQAQAIATPIVGVLNKISGQIAQIKNNGINNKRQSNSDIRNTSKQEYLDIKKQFNKLSGKDGFKMSEASNLFSKLDTKHQQSMFNNNPGTKLAMKQASLAWFGSQKDLSKAAIQEGQTYINSIYKGMEQGRISVDKGIELIGQPQKWGHYLGTETAMAYSQSFIQKSIPIMKENTAIAHEAAISSLGFNPQDYKVGSKELKNLFRNDKQLATEYASLYSGFRGDLDDTGHGQARGKVSDMGRFANDIGAVADRFTQAGYGITTFGNALSQLGGPLGIVGNGIAALGGAISTIGASISGATGLISLFTVGITDATGAVVVAGSTIAAVAAPLAVLAAGFLLVRHHIKQVKEAGAEVTETFKETNKTADDNIAKLKSYQGELAQLSKGVDSNGNNVNLDDFQYQRYLEIVDDIAAINPEIVEGYNAQGHAIINNNKALAETLKKQQEIRDEAYKAYTEEGSLQKLINARNISSEYRNNIVNPTSTKAEDAGLINSKKTPFAADVRGIADLLSLSVGVKDFDFTKYGIDSLDALKNGEEKAVQNFVKHRQQIETDLSNSGVKLSDAVIEGFDTLGDNVDAFDEAIKPVYDNLLTSVSKSKLFESLAPEIQEAFKDGLKDIAAKNLNANQMQQAVNYLGIEFQNAFNNAKPLLDQADEALNTFAEDLDEAAYNDTASNLAEQFRTLAAQAEAAGQVEIAEWYENQASRITNAITEATESIAENIDTLSDNIAIAKSNFEALGKGIDDYYTLADQAHGLVETALEEKNTEGNGSKTFWNTYRGLASEESFNKHDINEAVANMKQFQKYFTEGAEGSRVFAQKMIEWQEKSFEFTDKNGKTTTKQLKDFFDYAEDGTMRVTDAFTELSDEQYAQLASVFDLSADGFTAILNKLRQFGDLDFTDVKGVRKAMAFDERSVKTNRKVEIEGEDDVNRLYYGQSMLDAETAGLEPEQKETLINDLKVQGAVELPHGAEELLKAPITEEGPDGGLLKQFVQDTKGTGNQVENVMKGLYQSGEYNKDELEKIHTALTTDERYGLTNAQDANVDFEKLYSGIEQLNDPTAETNSHLGDISSTVNTIAGIIAAGKVGEGYLPDAAKQSGNLYNELVGKKGVADTWAQLFSKGKDRNGNVITDDAKYRELDKQLTEYATANNNYLRELKQGREAAINNGASPETIEAFDKEIEAATHNAELIEQYSQDAADNYDRITKDSQYAADATIGRFQEISNQGLTTEQNKTEITGALQGLATNLQNLDFNPEQIQSIFKDNFGIELELKGGEFATDVGKQIEEQINNLGEAEINAILNISSINMAAAARGKNNTPSAIRRVGTMARGSKRGYTINGEPTLTGELGPELVWEPKQNSAYMVGEHGPQFANISKNAVVWNAQQTKKIKKNSKGINPLGTGARGIHSFGTMAGGNIGGTKIPGTLEVDANANILEVIPPTPEPEIPVKAELEVEGNNGGILGKLFGGKNGPSINVAANVTSINTEEEQKTIQVIGNITKLNNETTVNSIDATATVTRVVKSGQISGEPISVKAVATTTTVKNETPGPKESTKTQIIKVSADTSVAQAKINQLINVFNRVYTLRYTASGPTSISVPISANFTGSWERTVKINKAANGMNNHIGYRATPFFGSAAKGKYGTIGPKDKGGLTLTGEKGFEIAWLPNENRSMILGVKGPQMLNLPNDAVVYTHEQSKKILKQKFIPAGSHGDNTARGANLFKTLGLNVSNNSGGTGTGNNNDGVIKQQQENADDAATIIQKAGKVSVWWENMTRRIETTQRNIDKTQKKFDNLLKAFGGTAKQAQTISQDYKKYLNKSIDLNKAEVKKANRELKKLDNKGKTSISYEVKKNGKKTTKPEKVKLGKYIKQLSDGTYIIDQKLITKEAKKNKSKAKAIKDAAEQKINDKVSKRNKAQDEIAKAQEALDKLADDVYTTFYQWENSLNKIYFLSKRINDLSTQANIRSGQESLLSAKALAGFGGDRNELLKVLKQQGQIMQEQVSTNQQNLQATKQVYEDSLKLSTYEQRYKKAPDSKEAKADFEAAKWALGFLKAGGTFNEAQITKLEAQGYNSDTIERIKKVIEDIDKKRSDALNASADSFKTITEIYNKIAEYQEYISSFESELLSGLEEQTEKEINKLDKINANLSKAFKELLDEVKYQLDERRKKEDNIKTEKDLSQKQQRLTALQADTSGGHQVEIAQLQKEIAEAQQSHQRSLEDQLIEKLQHQGDKAEQQRQQQIDILNAQKELASELGTNLAEVKEWLKDPDKNKEQIKQAWLANKNYDELPQNEQEKLENEFEEAWMKYGAYSQEVDRLKELTSNNDYLNKNTLAIQQMTEAIIGNKTPDMTSTLGGNTSSSTSSSTSKSSNQNTTDKKSLDNYLNKYNEAVTAKRNGKKFGWIDDGSKASKYYTKLLEYSANGKLSDKELTNLISYGKAIGYSVKRVVSDLAKTDELTWVDIIKAAKKAKFSKNEVKTWGSSSAFTKAFNDWSKYATGGLADYTGPAWLDGTPSKPELVLNAQDTKNFIALKDVLSKAIGSTSSVENTSNNATFEININVDHLNNDYDVDKVVERVKKKIVQDSSYRNVTQVRKFR